VSPGFGQVPPKPRWRGLLIGRLWTFQVLALRATPKWKPSLQSAFSPPSNFASARIACNFPPRKSAGNGCKLRGPLQL
jgi:hypothetical protein